MFDPKANNPVTARNYRIAMILLVLVILGKYGNDFYRGYQGATAQVRGQHEISGGVTKAKDSLRRGDSAQALVQFNEVIIEELQSRFPDFTNLSVATLGSIKIYLQTQDWQMARLTFDGLVDISRNSTLNAYELGLLINMVEEIYDANDPTSNADFALEVSNFQAELARQFFPPESDSRAAALSAIEARDALIAR